MKIQAARLFAQSILIACEQAEAEGRDQLTKSDIDTFSGFDDEAREELAAAIAAVSSLG